MTDQNWSLFLRSNVSRWELKFFFPFIMCLYFAKHRNMQVNYMVKKSIIQALTVPIFRYF